MSKLRLRDPLVFSALVLLILNDHWLKHSSYAGILTGKISDFAGLFFFPFFLYDIFRFFSCQNQNTAVLKILVWGTGIAFVKLKTTTALILVIQQIYAYFGSRAVIVQDASDLYALIVLPCVILWERKIQKESEVVA